MWLIAWGGGLQIIPMDTADILTLIGGIGGMQSIIELLKWWRGRKLRDRHDIADVKAAEDENSIVLP